MLLSRWPANGTVTVANGTSTTEIGINTVQCINQGSRLEANISIIHVESGRVVAFAAPASPFRVLQWPQADTMLSLTDGGTYYCFVSGRRSADFFRLRVIHGKPVVA